MHGQIQARRVKVGGKVRATSGPARRIEVLACGRIEGDVSAPRVVINAGAFFKGKVEMTSDAPRPSAASGQDAAGGAEPQPEQKQLDGPAPERRPPRPPKSS